MNIFIYSYSPLCLQTLVREATLEMIKTRLRGELAPRAAFCFAFFNTVPFNLSSASVSTAQFPPVLFFFFGEINISCFGELCMYNSFVFSLAVNASYICLHQLVSSVSVHTTVSIWPAHHYSDAMGFFPFGSAFCVI